ncbi:MAG: 16S rRNA (cytosine(1402)-N(4))-methyltransferase RsmH [Woeseiaceae bacterium]|nr:16S rRNA (cytosine(1402)-N(4))-methyltransferase RsmH [Woeseiaceae bacterium]
MAGRAGGEHVPVLRSAVLAGLNIRPGGTYVDGTFGRGGHSRAILERLGPEGRLLAIDRDPQAVAAATALSADTRFAMEKREIAQLDEIIEERRLRGRVDGLLLDLGVSSPQLDDAERGFSFRNDGPLDMRMDPTSGQSAAQWLAAVDEKTLKSVLKQYGEERHAGRIARAIVRARAGQPITRTAQLAAIVAANAGRGERKHPATRTFQALRIAVNDELGQLDAALAASRDALAPGGRLCVISFHSLEDRRVKRFMRDNSREPAAYRGLPSIPPEYPPSFAVVGRAVKATADEIAVNERARSARLRIAERI